MSDLTPPEIAKVIATFDQRTDAFAVDQVSAAVGETRREIGQLSDGANKATFNEILAFALIPWANQPSPWGSYFGPIATLQRDDGQVIYRPDPTSAKPTPPRLRLGARGRPL